MSKQKLTPQMSKGLIAGISVAALAFGAGGAWWATKSIFKAEPIPENKEIIVTAPRQTETATIQVFWVKATEAEMELIPAPITVTVEELNRPEKMLYSAFKRLLAGSSAGNEYTTAIPEGTRLLNLSVKDNETIVNLSEEFTFGGGTASMTSRLGQVIYTASSLDPQTSVRILVEGEPLEVLGGEGLIVEQPTTRAIFKQDFQLAKNKN